METSIVKASVIQSMTTDDVMSVYSGKVNMCCCGCAGNHRYNSKYREIAGVDRGYDVTDEDINDRQVKKVLNLIKTHEAIAQDGDSYIAIELENRLYIVYRLPEPKVPALPESPGFNPLPVAGSTLAALS